MQAIVESLKIVLSLITFFDTQKQYTPKCGIQNEYKQVNKDRVCHHDGTICFMSKGLQGNQCINANDRYHY